MLETKAIEILKTDIEEKAEDDEVLRKVQSGLNLDFRFKSRLNIFRDLRQFNLKDFGLKNFENK